MDARGWKEFDYATIKTEDLMAIDKKYGRLRDFVQAIADLETNAERLDKEFRRYITYDCRWTFDNMVRAAREIMEDINNGR